MSARLNRDIVHLRTTVPAQRQQSKLEARLLMMIRTLELANHIILSQAATAATGGKNKIAVAATHPITAVDRKSVV